ncbi:MAG: hypothetical protein IT158_28900 [Bryobacterales bacterium]|nr:hypothetical protein [Bryobacterales bacterium]
MLPERLHWRRLLAALLHLPRWCPSGHGGRHGVGCRGKRVSDRVRRFHFSADPAAGFLPWDRVRREDCTRGRWRHDCGRGKRRQLRRRQTGRGGLVSLFGTGLTDIGEGVVAADAFPLPTELRGTRVLISGQPAPLLALASRNGMDQINFQVPWRPYGTVETIVVVNNGKVCFRNGVTRSAMHPGIFLTADGSAIIEHEKDGSLVTGENPAAAGETLIVYVTGLGDVQPDIPAGYPAPPDPPRTVLTPEVMVAGAPAQVLFSGLVPGYAGLYRVKFQAPPGVPSGLADLVLSKTFPMEQVLSNKVMLPFR